MKKITYYGNTKDFKNQELLIKIFPICEKKCKVNSLCTNTLLLIILSCSTTALLLVSLFLITSPRQFRSIILLSNSMALWLPYCWGTLLPLLKTIFRLFIIGNNTSSSDSGCLFSRVLNSSRPTWVCMSAVALLWAGIRPVCSEMPS